MSVTITSPSARRRGFAALALALTVGAGIASRTIALPGILCEHAGDALYAAACYWLWALLLPRARNVALAFFAWGTAALVELSQLVHTPWLDELRQGPARWVLGQGYKHEDLLAYALGALLAAVLDALFRWRSPPPPAAM